MGLRLGDHGVDAAPVVDPGLRLDQAPADEESQRLDAAVLHPVKVGPTEQALVDDAERRPGLRRAGREQSDAPRRRSGSPSASHVDLKPRAGMWLRIRYHRASNNPPETVGGAREPSGPGRPAQVRSKARASRACLRAGSFRSAAGDSKKTSQRWTETQKEAAVAELTEDLKGAEAIFAVDYRGISVTGAAELRRSLREADAGVQGGQEPARQARRRRGAGTESLDELLVGPTALTLIHGDAVIAAKAIVDFAKRPRGARLQGRVHGRRATLDPDGFKAIARLPGVDVLRGQLVGLAASPITGLVRGLGSMMLGPRVASSARSPSRAW